MIKGSIKLELDPSGRCRCSSCEKHIPKGYYRVVERIGSGKWQKVNKFCCPCSIIFIDSIYDYITEIMTVLRSKV